MKKNKSSISKMQTHEEIGEYWDTHDLAEHWEKTKPAEFEVDIQSEVTYFNYQKRSKLLPDSGVYRRARF